MGDDLLKSKPEQRMSIQVEDAVAESLHILGELTERSKGNDILDGDEA